MRAQAEAKEAFLWLWSSLVYDFQYCLNVFSSPDCKLRIDDEFLPVGQQLLAKSRLVVFYGANDWLRLELLSAAMRHRVSEVEEFGYRLKRARSCGQGLAGSQLVAYQFQFCPGRQSIKMRPVIEERRSYMV